jgi:hypothetical protein
MPRCLQDYHNNWSVLLDDCQTPCGFVFLCLILGTGISFPIIGYVCLTSTACLPSSGEILIYIGSIIDVTIAGMIILYIIRILTYTCVNPPPPLTAPPPHAFRSYRQGEGKQKQTRLTRAQSV